MSGSLRKILLVEDNPGDVRLLQDILIGAQFNAYAMEDVAELEAASTLLSNQTFDVVLLDLGLPDSNGIATLNEVVALAPSIPVVVLTGDMSDDQAIELIRAGAQDYLTKGQLTSPLLRRAIEYSIERHRLNANLSDARREAERERELQSLERFSLERRTRATAESFGVRSIRETDQGVFDLLVEDYISFIDGALERRMHGEAPSLESRVRAFAQRMGSLRASPRDLTEIYVAAHRLAMKNAHPAKRDAIGMESQLLLIETMGYLALYYRAFVGPAVAWGPAKEV